MDVNSHQLLYLRASYATNRYCFDGVCLSVCLCVGLSTENLKDYWSDVDVTW